VGELLEGKLHEQFLWGGAGNGRGSSAPRQSLTRQLLVKWIKQHLRIKSFFGTSENAVKVQIWTAVSTYLLVAIMKKELRLEQSLYSILQVLSLSLFEKMPILEAFSQKYVPVQTAQTWKQLSLFD